MARCGRCGLWNQYPDEHHEKKYAGMCVWFQIRLESDSVYEPRDCAQFFEKVPGVSALDHFSYKVQRDNLGDTYATARFSKRLSILGAVISLISITLALWGAFNG